jgi:hypothetical protein
MLDDLRNSATGNSDQPPQSSFRREPTRRSEPFLGMTPVQRFVLALLLFMMTCVLGAGCLVLTGKVFLPFF